MKRNKTCAPVQGFVIPRRIIKAKDDRQLKIFSGAAVFEFTGGALCPSDQGEV
jgi:hypothetical protein